MASTTFSVEDARKSILEDGFFCVEDPVVGERVLEIAEKGSPLLSEEGLEFCKLNVLDDERIRSILESTFEWCGLGLYRRFGSDSGHIFSFRRGGMQAGLQVLVVHLWSSGSRVVYHSKSHLHSLNSVQAANGLFEIPLANLGRVGSIGTELVFENGGLAILDARLAFEIKQGSPITSVFATEDELKRWAKIILPKSEDLVRKVAEMESKMIGVNVAFIAGGTR
ncbi:hypothetical protein G7Y89_g675 [Cudoniella acicularis]|uniref:Uncharacterized protein n=1 Tax=Cudoniella acicularis TaxID=354080 RepID=A0A8H4WA77_9HELO|nr:hypothetical protein G7Y89_g675 [Cudoniella acicularis]